MNTLNLHIQHRNLSPNPALASLIEEKLRQLAERIPISAANVVVELREEFGPPVRIQAHLGVPGPDLVAEAADHTGPAAWHKVFRALEKQMEHRRAKQKNHWRAKLAQSHLGRAASALIGRRS